MFPFTMTFTGQFNQIEPEDRKRVIAQLEEFVKKNNGRQLTTSDDSLSFTVSFFGWSWEKFAQIERGVFTLTGTTIIFRVYMYRLFVFVTVMSFFGAVVSGDWKVGVFFFSWLGGVNVLTALFKFHKLTKKIAEGIRKLSKEKGSANRVFMK